jgi:hypothetical protein
MWPEKCGGNTQGDFFLKEKSSCPEAVFLVVRDLSMNEL